jgi:hypothetical protein
MRGGQPALLGSLSDQGRLALYAAAHPHTVHQYPAADGNDRGTAHDNRTPIAGAAGAIDATVAKERFYGRISIPACAQHGSSQVIRRLAS